LAWKPLSKEEKVGVRPVESLVEWPLEYEEFVRLFNKGDYFEAHEVLEDLWVIEVAPLKDYYKGLIQWAVAVCHHERGNPSGALKLYHSGARLLSPYPVRFEGLDRSAWSAAMESLFGSKIETAMPPLVLINMEGTGN
jgi:predicted metal-dependent hydrolase